MTRAASAPQLAQARAARARYRTGAIEPPFAVTHAPGHMLVTDVPDVAYAA